MVRRQIERVVQKRLRTAPAVALLGPRQSGKTTLARTLSPDYYDLEQEADRLRLDLEWESVVRSRRPVVLDEAQTWPELFPRLRGAIDADRKRNGRFLILGSVSPSLMHQVSESLAGRLSLVELTPLQLKELADGRLSDLWLRGGFPEGGILNSRRFPQWERDYLRLLVERDLPDWGMPAKPAVTGRLLKMLAAVHGQTWNASQIGKSLGLSYHTVNGYLDYLEGAYLIRRLTSWHSNIGKRLVKSPKIYWRDSGLLHATLGVSSTGELLSQPWVGASWEGFIIEQILAGLNSRGIDCEPCFLRTSDGHEIDLLLKLRGQLWAIEIKLTSNPSPDDFRRLRSRAEMVNADRCVLVSQTRKSAGSGAHVSCNVPKLLNLLGR